MIPTGSARISLIVAAIALIAYVITGESWLAMVFLVGIVFVALHWAYNGGWGPDSYGRRSGGLGAGEPVLGGQAGSLSQWVWYVIGVVGFLVAIAILMSIAQTF